MRISKLPFLIGLSFASTIAFADQTLPLNQFWQNAYQGYANVKENADANATTQQNIWEQFSQNGTYNVIGNVGYLYTGTSYYAYAGSLFAQSGEVAGFSLGGNFVVANPFFASSINPYSADQQAIFLPSNRVVTVSQLYLQYQFEDKFQANAGWITLDTPWVNSFDPSAMTQYVYQGGIVNVKPMDSVQITALAFNRSMPFNQSHFTSLTMYNPSLDIDSNTANITQGSRGTVAMGAQYQPNSDFNLSLWGYMFGDYANLLYASTAYTIPFDSSTSIHFGLQGGMEGTSSWGSSVFNNTTEGNVGSNLVGIQIGANIDWFGIDFSANNVWGNRNNYAQGGLVSPYTYQVATDPLYTTSIIAGLVEKSAGSAYKIAPTFTLLNSNLTITPSYAYYNTRAVPNSAEYDLELNYAVEQVQGLSFLVELAYLKNFDGNSSNSKEIAVNALYIF